MKIFSKEVQIALVAIVGIVVLFFGLNFLKGLSLLSTDDTYIVAFSDVGGLSASSPVYAGGYKIGVVSDIEYDYGKSGTTCVIISVDNRMTMPVETTAEIESDMLGNIKMNIILPEDHSQLLSAGDTIYGKAEAGLMTAAAGLMPAIEGMMPKLDSILVSLNTLLADEAIAGTLHNAEAITSDLTTTTKELNALMITLNREMPAMLASTSHVLSNAETLTTTLNTLDIASTMAKVDATLTNVEIMTSSLNAGDGTLGMLLHDKELYFNLASTISSADSLLTDLKAHPKRYVHFSLFGSKTK